VLEYADRDAHHRAYSKADRSAPTSVLQSDQGAPHVPHREQNAEQSWACRSREYPLGVKGLNRSRGRVLLGRLGRVRGRRRGSPHRPAIDRNDDADGKVIFQITGAFAGEWRGCADAAAMDDPTSCGPGTCG
jgi:hypothetical protein